MDQQWNTDSENLQSCHVVSGFQDQGLSRMSRSSSSSSSSSDSVLGDRFHIDEDDGRKAGIESLLMQSFPAVGRVDIQVSNSSSPDSPLDVPFEDGDEKHGKQDHGNSTIQSFPAIDRIDIQVCKETSRSSSSSSSSANSTSDVHLWDDEEEHEKTCGVNSTMLSCPDIDVLDDQVCSIMSRSSSSSSSNSKANDPIIEDTKEHNNTNGVNVMVQSPDQVCSIMSRSSSSSSSNSKANDPITEDTEEHKNANNVDVMVQFSQAFDGLDVLTSRTMSRSSSSSSSSSLESSFDIPMKEDLEHRNTDGVNLMMQSSPTVFGGLDVKASSKMSRSYSDSSPPESPSISPLKEDDKNQSNTSGIHLMVQLESASVVDGLDVQASSKMSRSSSSSSSPESSPKCSSEGGEKHRNKSTGNLVAEFSPAVDLVDARVSSKCSRSSSSSSSSSSSQDSPCQDPSTKDDQCLQSTASLPGDDNKAKVEDGIPKEPDSRKTLPTNEMPVTVSTTEVKNHGPESNSCHGPTTVSPPTQVMERPANAPYRIPSHVFARTKSTNPDWSVASNESLFSIQMGNMSFTGDQFFLKSQEFAAAQAESLTSGQTFSTSTGTFQGGSSASGQMFKPSTGTFPGESSTKPDQMFNFPTSQQPGSKMTDVKSHELAVETMKEVLKENEDQHFKVERYKGQVSHSPTGSSTSTRSFAFPVFTDAEKGHSVSTDGSSRPGRGHQRIESQNLLTPTTPSRSLEQTEEKDTPTGNQFGFGLRCLSCMSCCAFCR